MSSKKNERTKPIRRAKPSDDKLKQPPKLPPIGVAWLVAYQHRDAFLVHALALGKPVVAGRGGDGPVDFVIDDRSVSRQHARFVLQADGVHVTDLESTNRVCIRGQPVQEALLKVGDEVLLGDVRVVVHGDAGSEAGVSYDRLLAAIAVEITRSSWFHTRFVLAAVRRRAERGSDEAHVSRFVDAVVRGLRPVDQFALYGPEVLMVLLPQISQEEATTRFASAGTPLLDVGFANYPEDGQTVYELEERSLKAMHHPRTEVRLSEPTPEMPLDFVVASPVMQEVLDKADRCARSNAAVLIRGETGVGKEHIAKRIHAASKRSNGPFVAVNCATIQKELAQSILFGHIKGAFTGAVEAHKGHFEEADGGTLFLDEVAELPLETQASLLRVLEERKIRRVGDAREISVDVRVVAATHQPLELLVRQGKFREDLYFRLFVAVLEVPPLRARRSEIAALVTYFLEKFTARGDVRLPEVSAEALELLEVHDWPGNVRQLRNAIESALINSDGAPIEPRHLPAYLQLQGDAMESRERDTLRPGPGFVPADNAEGTFWEQTDRFQRALLEAALEKTDFNMARAGKSVGLEERTVRYHVKRLGILVPKEKK